MKKVLSVFLSLLFVFVLSAAAFAGDTSEGTISGLMPLDEFPAQEYTLKDALANARFANAAELSETFLPPSAQNKADPSKAVTWKYLSGGFTVYGQQNNYYCGPAVVKATLQKLNGSSPAQSIIAIGCKTKINGGTTLENMVSYVNARISTRDYAIRKGGTKTDMTNYLYSGLVYEMPPMIGFSCEVSPEWPYGSSGHAVNINGCTTDRTLLNLADPAIIYLGLPMSSFHNQTATALYAGYIAHGSGLAW